MYSACYYIQTVKWDYAIGAWKGSPRSTILIFFLLKGQEFIQIISFLTWTHIKNANSNLFEHYDATKYQSKII